MNAVTRSIVNRYGSARKEPTLAKVVIVALPHALRTGKACCFATEFPSCNASRLLGQLCMSWYDMDKVLGDVYVIHDGFRL